MERTFLLTVSGIFGALVSVGLELVLLGLAFGPVQKHRPQAAMFLAGSAGIQLLSTLLWYPASMLMARFVGVDGALAGHAALSLVTTLLHATSGVLLIVAILRMAIPSNQDPTRYS